MANDGGEKTHEATTRKIEKAQSGGNVARTRELGPALAFLSVASVAVMAGGGPWTKPFAWLGPALDTAVHRRLTVDGLYLLLLGGVMTWLPAALLLLGAAAAGSTIAVILQGGAHPTSEALTIDPSRLAPGGRLKSLFAATHFWDVGRGLIAAVTAGWIIYAAIKKLVPDLAGLQFVGAASLAGRIGTTLLGVAWKVGLGLALLGVFDLLIAKLLYMRSLKMSRQELKEEMQDQEGRPEVKMRRRRKLLELVKSRGSLAAVKRADVLITNPTHYAVALSYQRAAMGAPKVIAKGRNRMAAKIRIEAVKAGVPVVENPPLARELYKKVEVGREIPPELYLAVAEIIAFVMRLNTALDEHPVAGAEGAR